MDVNIQPFTPLHRYGADKTLHPISDWAYRAEPVESVVGKLMSVGYSPKHITALLNSREQHYASRFAYIIEGWTAYFAYQGREFMKFDMHFLDRRIERAGEPETPIDIIHGLLMQGFTVRAVLRLLNSLEKALPPVYTGHMMGGVAVINLRGNPLYCNYVEPAEDSLGEVPSFHG